MNVHLAEELLNELGSSLEALETQNAALFQFLKDKSIVTDERDYEAVMSHLANDIVSK